MKDRKLKSYVLPTTLTIGIMLVLLLTILLLPNTNEPNNELLNMTYVTDSILDNDQPVIAESTKVINPYTDASVKIGKYFYDYKGDSETQQKSIIYHDNTYMQNSGIDYISENVFDVVSVLDGTVANIKDDETLGKIVEIKHDNDYITIYQSLSEILVKKGDIVNQGQVIGKSGTNELDKEIGNHLHFEFYINGQVVDPNLYLNKELNSKKEN